MRESTVAFWLLCIASAFSQVTTIAQWTNGQPADVVLGQESFTTSFNSIAPTAGTIYNPQGIAVDSATGKVFIADASNHRVLRWNSVAALQNGATAEAVLGQPNFTSRTAVTSQSGMSSPQGLAMDNDGRLWVADRGNNRILRFDNAATKPSGANADNVLGQQDFTTRNLTVAQNRMRAPTDVVFDNNGNLWVADRSNNRVLRFDNAATKPNGANADGVLGQLDFTSNTGTTLRNGMNAPISVEVDGFGRLYVSERSNNRVIRFDNAVTKPNGADADGVLGQPDFISDFGDRGSGGNTLTQDRMNGPISVAVDGEGNLYVGDLSNRRKLVFIDAKRKPNGAPADFVLGQPDFVSNINQVTQSIAAAANQIAIDNRNGKIWLALGGFGLNNQNRVLRFSASRPLSVKYNDAELPKDFSLSQNYPNPFNPTTRFEFSIPSALKVSLKIYDLRGQEVATLINEHRTVGTYNVTFDANGISTGIYFYRLQAGSFVETKKMILTK